ncbi:MAG: beta-ketoacyl synthase chain length factor [Deltaproteobacteria bacterium]|nr:beta-ketoacyl synthase chain length factor [Deltaproteobacteria bacterium]
MTPSILGMGSVSALGCGIETLREGLIREKQPAITKRELMTPEGLKSLPVYTSRVEGLERFIPRNKLRRIDPFLQMGLLSSYLAIEDSGIDIARMEDKSRVGIIFGTGYGPLQTSFNFFDTLIDDGDKCASPTMFANSVHNALVSNVSIALKIEGPCQTLTCFDMTTWAVFSTASDWLERGIVDYVLAGVGDEYCEVRGYAVLLSTSDRANAFSPMDFNDCTYLPGEGFITFLMGKDKSKQGYGRIESLGSGKISSLHTGGCDAHFLAANGNSETGPYYNQLKRETIPAFAYSNLYGGMPAGQGFDIAIAALSLKEGALFSPHHNTGKQSKTSLKSIGCIQCDNNGNGSIIRIAS